MDQSKVLVTGASGFIGACYVHDLVTRGVQPCVLVNSTASGVPWRLLDVWPDVCVHEANLLDVNALAYELARHEISNVVHLGGFSHAGRSWPRAQECYQVNVIGTHNLLSVFSADVRTHLLLASTSEAAGDVNQSSDKIGYPKSPYAVSKVSSEAVVRLATETGQLGVATVVRIGNVYGPWQAPDRIIPEAFMAALRGRNLKITSGLQTRDFVYVDDVISGIDRLITSTSPVEKYTPVDFGSSERVSIADVAKLIFELVGGPGEVEVSTLVHRPNEIFQPPTPSSYLTELLGRKLTSLSSGLSLCADWYRSNLSRFC